MHQANQNTFPRPMTDEIDDDLISTETTETQETHEENQMEPNETNTDHYQFFRLHHTTSHTLPTTINDIQTESIIDTGASLSATCSRTKPLLTPTTLTKLSPQPLDP
eukprot:GHVP01004880.1.p3 GENE.GHVP01004880.1~~GHVP01004880.1.p3  ORF type:complete len:107 (+),score=16.76 GHVP01004880.1:110-430(+)